MGRLKAQLSWLLRGGASTKATLDGYGDHLRALQEKVARIDEQVQSDALVGRAREAQIDDLRREISALKEQLRAAVDDLGDRIGTDQQRSTSNR